MTLQTSMPRKSYYGSRFSPNMTATPEGFLICHNVPIARVGTYQYLGDEIGAPGKTGQLIDVHRSPDEVFHPAAIASFEGKPVVDEHPPEAVNPDNAARYIKGAVQNVRPGKDDENGMLVADLVVYDEYLINEIMDGKREVSCGYDTTYVPNDDGSYSQIDIRGNHVAVVKSGRAGDRVAIKDHKPKGASEKMTKKVSLPRQSSMTKFLAAVGLKQFAMDAAPEEIERAVDAMAEERAAADEEVQAPEKQEKQEKQDKPSETKDNDVAMSAVMEQVKALSEAVARLEAKIESKSGTEDSAEKALDDAIKEMEKETADDDESKTIEAEDAGAQVGLEGPVESPEDRPKHVIDNAYKVAALKAMKPILAAIPDAKERRKAADAAIASIKAVPKANTYAAIQKGQRKAAADTQKQQPASQQDFAELGKKWKEQFHRKPQGGAN